jgi:PAP2 superfamily C-terminal
METIKRLARRSLESHKNLWKDKSFILSFILGVVLLLSSFVISYFAGVFATKSVSSSVTDIILDNTSVWDVTFIFINGAVIFWAFLLIFTIIEPKRFPFALKSLALFTVIRSAFIVLTHLAPFPVRLMLPAENLIDMFSFGGDLFFSAHTGAPFMMALIYWDHKYIRYLCLASSVLFGIVVLLGHLHYSIDVFAAFFITYSIYHLSRYIFKKDFALIAKYENTQIS